MSESKGQGSLRMDDRLKAEDALYSGFYDRGDKKIMWSAIGVAILVHVIVFIVNFPERVAKAEEKRPENVVVVKKYVPPPPKVQKREVVQKKITKKVALPDPTPDEPEPIREPEPEIEDIPIPPDVEIVIGDPEPPPPSGPLLAGTAGVSNPVLIDESKVEPAFPEIARQARVEGNVILQAIIRADGTVGEVEVLRVNRPNMGFETAAIEAVQQWRYEPAMQNGRPVEVYFTVFVEFKLH